MADFIVRNPGSSDYYINDLGQVVGAGESIDLLPLHKPFKIANSESLRVSLQNSDLIRVKSSIDQPYSTAYNDLHLTTSAPQISASAAESQAEREGSLLDSVAERGQSLGRLRDSYSLSIARYSEEKGSLANSLAARAESLGRINASGGVDPSEARSLAGRAESIARLGESIANYQDSWFTGGGNDPPSTGGLWLEGGEAPYIYNPATGKWLSVAHVMFVYNQIGPADGIYLGIGGTARQDAGYYFHTVGMLLNVWCRVLDGTADYTKEFQLQDENDNILYSFNLPNGPIFSVTHLNIEIPANTILRVYCSDVGGKVQDPIVQIENAWIYQGT